ncbi:MAG: GWxTD domain-containing protein [bacterium]|nr:GWxTD domain-containing protein [bacterium]
MAVVTRRAVLPLVAGWLAVLAAPPVEAGLLQPLDGRGNFHSYVDVVNRWRDEEQLDVLVLVSVANGDLMSRVEEGRQVARLRLEVTLTGPDGREVTQTRHVRSRPLAARDASSRTLRQVFGVLLRDVPFRDGHLACVVTDVNRRRPGLLNAIDGRDARSEAAADWFAEASPRPEAGLALDDPLFLLHAPLTAWNPETASVATESDGLVGDYVHPPRTYGIEQDHLQLVVPVWPPAGGVRDPAQLAGLRLHLLSDDGIFALTDSIRFDARGRAALEGGRPAYLFYNLDVNQLPEGSYQLALAPLGGQGRGQMSGFSVVWRLGTLGRHQDLVAGEGFTVFDGAQRDRFLEASPTEREAMLDDFWERLNPEPGSPINPVRLEFQYRVAYVQQNLGGFGPRGALDGRGEVYILMGAPDSQERQPMPLNHRDQDDARVRVYDRFALERPGSTAKGAEAPSGQTPTSPYQTIGGIPIAGSVEAPRSRHAERDRLGMLFKAGREMGFELWKYDNGGKPLFMNRLAGKGMGQRFLFVDRTGTGLYEIESSNVIQGED